MNPEQAYGNAILISGPSGVGKSTICRELHRIMPQLRFSVSCTTRRRRPEEIDHKDYHFISEAEYNQHLANGDFLEHAEVHAFLYGTLKSELDCLRKGHDILMDIDVQGVTQVRQRLKDEEFYGRRYITAFIMPPSMAVLEKRLRGRGTETQEAIARRLRNAAGEMKKWREYDYVVINYEAATAAEELASIIRSSHLRTSVLTRESWNDEP